MIFTPLTLRGAFLIEPEKHEDERGFFARTWSRAEFEARGLNPYVEECSISFNPRRGTLRGMHYQAAPHEEAKLVRCTRGAIYDVIVDLRPQADTFMRWQAVELSVKNHRMLYVPEHFAHGFMTLEDESEIFYQISVAYRPESGRGVRWDDPAFAIRWPGPVAVISERDATFADFQAEPIDVGPRP